MKGDWFEDRKLLALLISVSLTPLLARSWNSWRNFLKLIKIASLVFCDRCLGIGCESVVVGEKNSIVCSLLCILFFIIVVIITIISIFNSISISFVTLWNCLCLNPCVFPFVCFFSSFLWRGKEGVSKRLSSVLAPKINYDKCVESYFQLPNWNTFQIISDLYSGCGILAAWVGNIATNEGVRWASLFSQIVTIHRSYRELYFPISLQIFARGSYSL